MIQLPQVTLLAATSVDLPGTELALKISSHDIEFGAIKLLTSENWTPSDPQIELVNIPKLDLVGYSRFMMCELKNYVDTPYCIVVQADGFVLNGGLWSDSFLSYDYIGAPWPRELLLQPGNLVIALTKNLVGNGGFSLRSSKLLQETAKINFENLDFPTKSEDLIICHFLYEKMVAAGIKFPSPELAATFSIESPDACYGQSPQTVFGFHGKSLRDFIFESILR